MSRFVATDADGVQHLSDRDRAWPLPGPDGEPGAVASVHDGEHPLVLLDADGLLDQLGERIFLAEELPDPGAPGQEVRAARLVGELPWSPETAAELALDCAEHARSRVEAGDGGGLRLPDGTSLADVLADARACLARAEAAEDGERHLGLLARLSLARRVEREQAGVAGLALAATAMDGEDDLDALEDFEWADLAALSSALLACAEALRHVALPRYIAARERTFAPGEEAAALGTVFVTPWGPVTVAGSRPPEYVPPYVSAREAAERSRQAVADQLGEAAAIEERGFQRARLLELLEAPAGA